MSKRTKAINTGDGRTVTVARVHGARYSEDHIELFGRLLGEETLRIGGRHVQVLDPMGGSGRIHELDPERFETVANELERPYVDLARILYPGRLTIQGDAAKVHEYFGVESFDAVVVSPDFGNRYSDAHNARERCRGCKGTGRVEDDETCDKCGGKGSRGWTRRGYTHDLRHLTGDPDYTLDAASSARYKGTDPRYWERQVGYWSAAFAVLRPGGVLLLDVSNFVLRDRIIPIVDGHRRIVEDVGFHVETVVPLDTDRMRFGANGKIRVEGHRIIVARKPLRPVGS